MERGGREEEGYKDGRVERGVKMEEVLGMVGWKGVEGCKRW